ncbi:MAG: SDR family NAD(P)-dependent oxidoreductase [Pirellulaceae bacterium]|nr:SDR family NAD(P)-dependent oxidoreductase [Pirellulaceae bacterium]
MSYWKDKVVIVTGGSAGLGLEIARAFSGAQAKVVIAARNPDRLAATVDQLTTRSQDLSGIATDVTNPNDVQRLIDNTIAKFGRLDVLVNNAGKSDRGRAISTSPDTFRELLELNFLGPVNCIQAAMPHIIKSQGHIISIGSLASKTASPFLGAYPASKFPIAAYSQQLRLELGPQGVHVLLVCPGPIKRDDAGQRYDQRTADLPASAKKPAGGAKLKSISPRLLAAKILRASELRRPELIVPKRARWLFAISQLWPACGDWIVRRKTS